MSGPRWRKAALPLAAAAALVYLVVMAVSGALPRHRQLVTFEAAGPLTVAPTAVRMLTLAHDGRVVALARADGGWLARRLDRAGSAQEPLKLDREASERLDMAIQMLHTSRPIRRLDATEADPARDGAAFGLDGDRLTARLELVDEAGTAARFGVRFGARNPEDTAQYLTIDDRPGILLMSRFVGTQWEAVATEVLAP